LVPTIMVLAAIALFTACYAVDRAAGSGTSSWPAFVTSGSPDAARQVLIGIAASVITVAGVLFSITILVLQLASQQFGPRMLRNFIRDLGTQVSLGAFVATFAYAVLALASVQSAPARQFVPHLSVTVALALLLVDLGVVIYFIHHVATSIQLTSVVSGIAKDFRWTVTNLREDQTPSPQLPAPEISAAEVTAPGLPPQQPPSPDEAQVCAQASGFIQAIRRRDLMAIATDADAMIVLLCVCAVQATFGLS
jgi:uncharacterized membrane protein